MAELAGISKIAPSLPKVGTLPQVFGKPEKVSFSDILAHAMESVDKLVDKNDQLTLDLALGRPVELHQVMLAATKAQLALELLIEIRNRLIESYQEINRMSI